MPVSGINWFALLLPTCALMRRVTLELIEYAFRITTNFSVVPFPWAVPNPPDMVRS